MSCRPKCKIQNYKFIKGIIGKNLGDLWFDNVFLDIMPKAQSIKNDKLDLIKLKTSVLLKTMSKE